MRNPLSEINAAIQSNAFKDVKLNMICALIYSAGFFMLGVPNQAIGIPFGVFCILGSGCFGAYHLEKTEPITRTRTTIYILGFIFYLFSVCSFLILSKPNSNSYWSWKNNRPTQPTPSPIPTLIKTIAQLPQVKIPTSDKLKNGIWQLIKFGEDLKPMVCNGSAGATEIENWRNNSITFFKSINRKDLAEKMSPRSLWTLMSVSPFFNLCPECPEKFGFIVPGNLYFGIINLRRMLADIDYKNLGREKYTQSVIEQLSRELEEADSLISYYRSFPNPLPPIPIITPLSSNSYSWAPTGSATPDVFSSIATILMTEERHKMFTYQILQCFQVNKEYRCFNEEYIEKFTEVKFSLTLECIQDQKKVLDEIIKEIQQCPLGNTSH